MLSLLLKIKYVVLVIYSKKLTITQKIIKLKKKKKKITDHNHDKYIATPEFKKFMAEIFTLRLRRANLGSKSDILIS